MAKAFCGMCSTELPDAVTAAEHVGKCQGKTAASTNEQIAAQARVDEIAARLQAASAPRALTDAEMTALAALMAHDAAFVQNDTAHRIANGGTPGYHYPTRDAEKYASLIEAELRRRGVLS